MEIILNYLGCCNAVILKKEDEGSGSGDATMKSEGKRRYLIAEVETGKVGSAGFEAGEGTTSQGKGFFLRASKNNVDLLTP